MIIVKIRFFAMLKKMAESEGASLKIPAESTVEQLICIIRKKYPSLSEAIEMGRVLISVNHQMVKGAFILTDGDEVALLPPFSGG